MDDEKVVVQEVRPAEVTKQSALRIFTGRFIVDFIETLAATLPIGVLFLPTNMQDVQKLALILGTPVVSALVSAARRGWPTLKDWLSPPEGRV